MLTLDQLLLPSKDILADRIKQVLDDERVEVRAGGTGTFAALGLRMMAGSLAGHVEKLLEISIGDVLAGAWNTSGTLRTHLEKSANAPGKEFFLQLAEHKITSEHHPYISVMKDGVEVRQVPFEVDLELVLQGAVLRLMDGAIQEVQVGRVKGKGSVKCWGATVVAKEIQPVAIPGTLKIAGTRAAAWMPAGRAKRAS